MTFGLENTGFNVKRFDDIKTELIEDLKNAFGNIRTDEISKFGLFINIMSKKFADIWEVLQAIYESFGIDAEGSALDDRVMWAGVTRLPVDKSRVDVTFIGTLGTVIPVGTLIKSTSTNIQFILDSTEDMSITDASGTIIPFIALNYGNFTAPENSVVLITPITGVSSIANESPAVPGRYTETDDALRIRFIQARAATGYCRFDAIKTRIEQELSGINSIAIFQNTSGAIDSSGRPPHSFEIVVDCVSSLHTAVAQKIWDVKPIGIETYGNTSAVATDSLGGSHTIYFSKVSPLYAWIKVSLVYSSEISFPVNGVEQIIKNIIEFSKSLQVGSDFIIQSFYNPIYSVKGITEAVIEIATTFTAEGTPEYVKINIAINSYNKLIFDSSRIIVV